MAHEVILISHENVSWPGARNLYVAETGHHLAITRNPVRDGASRLIEEGFSPSATMVIRDAYDVTPEVQLSIKQALAAR
jgi:hypothetical protein